MAHAATLSHSVRPPAVHTHEAEYALAATRFAATGKFPASLRKEYQYSRKDIRLYNHLMHKLETLSASIAGTKPQRTNWSLAVNPFRRQLYNELYQNNELVRAFGGSLPGGRMVLPEMDDWTLGIKRRNRFSMPFDMRKFQAPNAKAPTELLGDVHTALLIDDSDSMKTTSYSTQKTRWEEVRDLLGQIGPLLARYADPDFHNYDGIAEDEYRRTQLGATHTQGFELHFLHHPNPEQGELRRRRRHPHGHGQR